MNKVVLLLEGRPHLDSSQEFSFIDRIQICHDGQITVGTGYSLTFDATTVHCSKFCFPDVISYVMLFSHCG